jgi:hypothetical protein
MGREDEPKKLDEQPEQQRPRRRSRRTDVLICDKQGRCRPCCPDDPVDIALASACEAYGATVPFRRINQGFYAFGTTQVEVNLINGKLLARTEDGWNWGKYADIGKFIHTYEAAEESFALLAEQRGCKPK